MVVADLSSKKIFLDTAPLIYFIEGHSVFQPILINIFTANNNGDFAFITSCITLLEVLVKPIQQKQNNLVNQYRQILTTAHGITIYDITNSISVLAAQLRASYNLRTPDALQIATAIEYKADYFLTNDARLKQVAGVNSILVTDIQ
jgi:predicted nucleic acid-binding protein